MVVEAGGAVVEVVWGAAVVDVVGGLADLGRVVLVVDWPAVDVSELEGMERSGTDRSSGIGSTTTTVGSVVSGAIATMVVGMTATG